MNYEITDFQTDVIKRSHEVPVLVDFWAEWCEPCKVLGPILERLAGKSNGEWVLAKVDTDVHQDLAVEYGVRGIPNVKLFVDGKVANEFVGVLPEVAVAQWLKKALPNKSRKEIERARQLWKNGHEAEARTVLEAIVQRDPENEHARVLLAGALISSEPERAAQLVEGIEEHSEHFPMADAIRTFRSLNAKRLTPEALPEDPAKQSYVTALEALATLKYEQALEKFIEIIRINRYYDDDGARKACIAVFKILGEDHEVTRRWRREFSSALYA